MDYGRINFNLVDILTEKDISKNRICKDLDIPRSILNKYCRNEFQRIDAGLLCKLCSYLEIGIGDLLTYTAPSDEGAVSEAD